MILRFFPIYGKTCFKPPTRNPLPSWYAYPPAGRPPWSSPRFVMIKGTWSLWGNHTTSNVMNPPSQGRSFAPSQLDIVCLAGECRSPSEYPFTAKKQHKITQTWNVSQTTHPVTPSSSPFSWWGSTFTASPGSPKRSLTLKSCSFPTARCARARARCLEILEGLCLESHLEPEIRCACAILRPWRQLVVAKWLQ